MVSAESQTRGPASPAGPRVVVFGAGASAAGPRSSCAAAAPRVTLVDAWGPGNARASSGGETRVIRATYGARTIYTKMAMRAMALWRAHDARYQRGFFRKTGALWMFGNDDCVRARVGRGAARGGVADRRADAGGGGEALPADRLRRHDQVRPLGAGSRLPVRTPRVRARARVLRRRRRRVSPGGGAGAGGDRGRSASSVSRSRTGRRWRPTRSSSPAVRGSARSFPTSSARASRRRGRRSTTSARRPATRDSSIRRCRSGSTTAIGSYYGIPGNANRGFKVADDTPGPPIDPSEATRDATPAGIAAARRFLAERFPPLAGAPLLGSEVCQYEASPDSHFIIDRHPRAAERLDRRRRLRTWLQDGAGDW